MIRPSFQPGERVRWTYTHHLNSRSSIERSKDGEFLCMKLEKRYVTHGPYQRSTHLARVILDGNRWPSLVSIYQLEKIPPVEGKS